MSPFDALGAYNLLQYSEICEGILYPLGGFAQVPLALQRIAERNGAKFRFEDPVKKVIVEGGVAKGVITEKGEELRADVVLVNADLIWSMAHLYEETSYSKRLEERPVSCSSISFYWSMKRCVTLTLSRSTLFLDVLDVNIADFSTFSSESSFHLQENPGARVAHHFPRRGIQGVRDFPTASAMRAKTDLPLATGLSTRFSANTRSLPSLPSTSTFRVVMTPRMSQLCRGLRHPIAVLTFPPPLFLASSAPPLPIATPSSSSSPLATSLTPFLPPPTGTRS